jgi:DNA-binding NtrC family response regulator
MDSRSNRALIVEDDRSWQEILSEILIDSGLVVDVVDNVESAAAILKARAHRLAVVDVSLDRINHNNQDGLLVLDLLRDHDPNCQMILLTGFATVELAVTALTEHRAYTVLRKETLQLAEFRDLIRKVLTRPPEGGISDPLANGGQSWKQSLAENRSLKKKPVQEEAIIPINTALVVEDDAGWRSIFVELLSDDGFRVRSCSSYGEGLGCLRREKYALAVVDLSLMGPIHFNFSERSAQSPGSDLDGYRLLTSTKAAGIPTIVVSGVAAPEDIERAYSERGIFAFLQKQVFNRQVFLQTVNDALNAARANRELDQLTEREREVLSLLAQGSTNKRLPTRW